jgi:hypothetical protein
MVEAFIQNHPDLKEELDILLQYKLVPDTDIVFAHKEELMVPVAGMTSNNFVTSANYEQWLVLYTDNELSAEQRMAVERFIAANPSAKKELALIQQSKLQPEEIIFADKASLYRKEEKVRPMPVRWWRIAAAAVLLFGIGITAALVINNKSSGGNETVKNIPAEKKTNTESPVLTPEKINNPVNETAVADNTVKQQLSPESKQPLNNTVTTAAVKEKDSKVKDRLPFNTPVTIKKDEPVIAENNNDRPSNNLPQPLNNSPLNKNDATNNGVAGISTSDKINTSGKSLTEPPVTNPYLETSDKSNSDATFASLEEGGKNKKNRGFLRKVARTFEKRTSIDPTDDGKLLVAGLSFKLK